MHQIGIKVAPGADVQIAVTPKIIDIDQSALHFQPINRECYLEEEFGFNYLPDYDFRYRMSNCLFEGAYEEILYRCNCTPSFHQTGIKEYPVICTGTKLKCMKYILQRIGKYNEVSYPIH